MMRSPLYQRFPATATARSRCCASGLNTELFHTVNGFSREGMTALSPEAAAPFLGDLKRCKLGPVAAGRSVATQGMWPRVSC